VFGYFELTARLAAWFSLNAVFAAPVKFAAGLRRQVFHGDFIKTILSLTRKPVLQMVDGYRPGDRLVDR
jgi:hypothetical protein